MDEIYLNPNNINSLKIKLSNLELDPLIKSVLFFMADDQQYSNDILTPILQKNIKPIIGGIFPELIFKGERKKTGILLIPLQFTLTTQLIDLNTTTEHILEELEITQKNSIESPSALFVFIDALSDTKNVVIETLFNFFGINPTYIGGGAGSLKFKSFPCIINNSGMHKNMAIIGWANKKIAIGAAHGWESISQPLKVTLTNKNEVVSINWKPAFEVYKEIVEKHSGKKFTETNFFDIAKSYPLGISKIDAEKVVRDPFKITNNHIHFIDKINEGEYLEVLHGNTDSLLKGAAIAREKTFSNSKNNKNRNSIFCIDCISRALYMNKSFIKELEVIGKNVPTSGILSIGEIANSGESFLEIYNKTIVTALW